MCELLAMSAHFPTHLHVSLEELARRGGETGPHRDGWGVAYVQEGDALVVREPEAASTSRRLGALRDEDVRSSIVLAHIRRATQGERLLRNTQPFARELGGRVHVFAHNGMLKGIELAVPLATRRFTPIGGTDSEHAFCILLERLAPLWDCGVPSLDERRVVVEQFAAALRPLGPSNFIYTDTNAVFAHGHRRTNAAGLVRPPGLHVLCRRCDPSADGVPIAAVSIPHEAQQEVALLASVPLSAEPWTALEEGEVVVLRDGRKVGRAV